MARRNAEASGASNTEFHHATIDKLPLPNGSVDCVISNCVINLAPDKQAVFKEIARVLKPGVRLAVSDIVLKQPLPPEVADDLIAYIGCIAGAISVEAYRSWLVEAGFGSVQVIDTKSDLNAYTKVFDPPSAGVTGGLPLVDGGCCGSGVSATAAKDSQFHQRLADTLARFDVNDYAASVRVFAVKPN